MSEFENVTILKHANIYFDGKVNSRTLKFSDGSIKTLGFMMPGEYTFNTDAAENMEILAGKLQVKLADSDEWKAIQGGEAFDVPANSSFSLIIETPTDYCCSFLG